MIALDNFLYNVLTGLSYLVERWDTNKVLFVVLYTLGFVFLAMGWWVAMGLSFGLGMIAAAVAGIGEE